MNKLPVFEAKTLKHAGIRHLFFGRGDDPSTGVHARAMGVKPAYLVGIHQVHSAKAVIVTRRWPSDAPKADAMVSATPGMALSIRTADCAPILFADPKAGVVGAAHAGWRGALDGIIGATITTMQDMGAETDNIHAAIGPCIAQTSYEVGPEFLQTFTQADATHEHFFMRGKADRWHFDLKAFCQFRLRHAGVNTVETLPQDTCADENDFFSYRRATLRGESDYGRNISVILLQQGAENRH